MGREETAESVETISRKPMTRKEKKENWVIIWSRQEWVGRPRNRKEKKENWVIRRGDRGESVETGEKLG